MNMNCDINVAKDLNDLNDTVEHLLAQGRLMYNLRMSTDKTAMDRARQKLIDSTVSIDKRKKWINKASLLFLHRFNIPKLYLD